MLPLPRSALGAVPAATAHERERPARVLKTFSPTQAGALKLARRFGDALVCVRHRASPDGAQRITTVERVVAVEPMQRRQHADQPVALRLDFRDRAHRPALPADCRSGYGSDLARLGGKRQDLTLQPLTAAPGMGWIWRGWGARGKT